MAINPPTDIVSDVLKAADPSTMEVARARLNAGQAAMQAQRLASSDASFDAAVAREHIRSNAHLNSADRKEIPESYRKFEGMVLSSMLKSMMPDSEEIYGKGATGEIWKGMMAEQLGNEMSKNGGIGIAEKLTEGGATRTRTKEAAEANRSDRLHMATQVIEENQMRALDKFLPVDRKDKKA
ncbi:rod-binding protein [Rhizobium sp. KVB221]|uniref:Rod-binding protein n=1 Tax=Rhizobium setariae TaxID=2801340 RepID=A0A937CN35_9HYPH|nr:rod-binding protein [Rhizobium setariae]MBL0370703.1 rod-binding protein [Rhizobium setariae]